MKNYPKFSLDTEVVVERRLPNPSYKGLVKKIMVHEIGFYYYIESEYEEPLWVIEDENHARLLLTTTTWTVGMLPKDYIGKLVEVKDNVAFIDERKFNMVGIVVAHEGPRIEQVKNAKRVWARTTSRITITYSKWF